MLPQTEIAKLKMALDELDNIPVYLDGHQLKPSQCYHLELNPPHVLFNTNCPENIRERVNRIFQQFIQQYETGSSEKERR
jgi:hypothetical protein